MDVPRPVDRDLWYSLPWSKEETAHLHTPCKIDKPGVPALGFVVPAFRQGRSRLSSRILLGPVAAHGILLRDERRFPPQLVVPGLCPAVGISRPMPILPVGWHPGGRHRHEVGIFPVVVDPLLDLFLVRGDRRPTVDIPMPAVAVPLKHSWKPLCFASDCRSTTKGSACPCSSERLRSTPRCCPQCPCRAARRNGDALCLPPSAVVSTTKSLSHSTDLVCTGALCGAFGLNGGNFSCNLSKKGKEKFRSLTSF